MERIHFQPRSASPEHGGYMSVSGTRRIQLSGAHGTARALPDGSAAAAAAAESKLALVAALRSEAEAQAEVTRLGAALASALADRDAAVASCEANALRTEASHRAALAAVSAEKLQAEQVARELRTGLESERDAVEAAESAALEATRAASSAHGEIVRLRNELAAETLRADHAESELARLQSPESMGRTLEAEQRALRRKLDDWSGLRDDPDRASGLASGPTSQVAVDPWLGPRTAVPQAGPVSKSAQPTFTAFDSMSSSTSSTDFSC
eukprot:c11575_g1_i2.p1 GENE.c11575_g1_i2~~c11575_g1_i2.p1  ORF type:complete len:268 (-),score=17.05 c11575_g1_i2:316-1119(-)